MPVKVTLLLATAVLLVGCEQPVDPSVDTPVTGRAAQSAQSTSQGLTRKAIPEEDPGPPFYARVSSILNQFFHTGDWLAIPFYREPSCVPLDLNMLELFHFPGPEGPGALACPLLVNGFLLIEPEAPLGTFPRQVVLTGNAVAFWFVSWNAFQAAALDDTLTMTELQALQPLKGTATSYHETLRPREGDHTIVINARGLLEDGRAFEFHVTHLEDQTKSIQIRFGKRAKSCSRECGRVQVGCWAEAVGGLSAREIQVLRPGAADKTTGKSPACAKNRMPP